MVDEPVVQAASLRWMRPLDLYGVLKVRQDVFVVEQTCPYPDIDEVDRARGTVQLWVAEAGQIVATARVYRDDDATHIGRVATVGHARGRGYAAALIREGIARCRRMSPRLPVRIGAQAYLERWYERFGFTRCGDDYLEDDIVHVPMVLERAEPVTR